MSNYLAIATVTAALRQLLLNNIGDAVSGAGITIVKPKTTNGASDPEINIYLYQAAPNQALRNTDLPTRSSDGSVVRRPQVALDLFYLLTFYGNEVDHEPQRLMGHATSVLHDHPILTQEDIQEAISNGAACLADSDLAEQIEKVKLTPVVLDLEELSKLWTVFLQAPYSLSVVYQASVVLIQRDQPVRSPLPVLTRGPGDAGVITRPNLMVPFPALETVTPPNNQISAVLRGAENEGDILTMTGHHLDGTEVKLIITNKRLLEPIELTPMDGRTSTEIRVRLPDTESDEQSPAQWPVGFYTVSVRIAEPGEEPRFTNELVWSLAPRITTGMPLTTMRDEYGNANVDIDCVPEVRPIQPVSLLIGDREIPAVPLESQTGSLTFQFQDARVGEHWVRLRVEGIESLLIDRSVEPPMFDTSQKAIIEEYVGP